MSDPLSPNTKAILLLTAPLIAGRAKEESVDLLNPGEYKKLALHLREIGKQPADLLGPNAAGLLGDCDRVINRSRLERLLARGFLLSQAVERWQTRAIWVVSRADGAYPQGFKGRLKEDSPAVLYGCGERQILDTGGLAVVGSRNADDSLIEFARRVGFLAARANRTLVSGGARGVDQAAMHGASEAGGRVTGVLADSLEKTAMNREHRKMLMDGQLVLISPYDPNAGFNVGHAMQRNKMIYALADVALVVSAELNKGGTWAGATEQLDKLHFVPVYVRSTGETGSGLDALRKKGAFPWPNPDDADALNIALFVAPRHNGDSPSQAELYFTARQQIAKAEQVRELPSAHTESADRATLPVARATLGPAEELFGNVRALSAQIFKKPRTLNDFICELEITKRQAEEWLRRLVKEGVLEKRKKPVSYVIREVDLFMGATGGGVKAGGGKAEPSE